MKKILALLPAVVLAAACSSPSTNKTPAAPEPNKAAETKPATAVTQAEMETREKATWEALERKNFSAFGELLATDYLEVGDDGVFDKTTLLNYVKDLNTESATFADWKMLSVNKNLVLLMYNVTIKGTFKGQTIPPGPYRASSVWANRDGKWLAVFYQQTAVHAAPAAPAGNQAAKPATSPTGKAGEAGPDPVANEKLVWDAIKSRNAKAFGSFLANDSVEVEADAVYDKSASVKSIAAFDASKAELSDWKSLKIDNEASVVSYLVKIPGGPPERHSTLWINRAGKWQALFHQGTPETPPAKVDVKTKTEAAKK